MKTTIKEEAAKASYYTLSDVPEQWKSSAERISDKGFFIPPFLRDNPKYEVGCFWPCKTEKSGGEVLSFVDRDRSVILIKAEGPNLYELHKNRDEKYYLTVFFPQHPAANRVRYSDLKNMPEKPNYIGVFTDKKLEAWTEYCDQHVGAIKEFLNEQEARKLESKKIVDTFLSGMKDVANVKIQRSEYQGIYHTHVSTPIFDVEIRVNKETGELTTIKQFKGILNDVVDISTSYRNRDVVVAFYSALKEYNVYKCLGGLIIEDGFKTFDEAKEWAITNNYRVMN